MKQKNIAATSCDKTNQAVSSQSSCGLKEALDNLSCEASKSSNSELSSKICEIKGLYTAYELSSSSIILEKVAEGLAEIIQSLLTDPVSSQENITTMRSCKDSELSDFYNYLITCAVKKKTPSTADNYRKALRQVIARMELKDLDELTLRIDDMINAYEGNDRDSHNSHVAALKQYKNYLKYKEDTANMQQYKITKDNFDGTEETVWKKSCSEAEAMKQVVKIIKEQSEEYRKSNYTIKWRIIRLYDSNGHIIAQES